MMFITVPHDLYTTVNSIELQSKLGNGAASEQKADHETAFIAGLRQLEL